MSRNFDLQAESAARMQAKFVRDARAAGGMQVQDSFMYDMTPEQQRQLETRMLAHVAPGRPERAKLVWLGLVRPRPRQALRPIHVPPRYPVLRLDEAGKGHAYVRVRRELALIEKERVS